MQTTIDIHETGDETAPYIGKLFIESDKTDHIYSVNKNNVHTIIIMDVSGSMGDYVQKIITRYIPDTLLKLKYDQIKDLITLITFSHCSNIYTYSGIRLRSCTQKAEGTTYMSHAITNLRKVINESKCKYFRILTISDGQLHDQIETINKATLLASEINGKYVIRSSAIRLFTSNQQPDTRGLSSVLQLNNGNTKLIDFQCPSINEEFINVFSDALTDNLGSYMTLTAKTPIFLTDPWSTPKTELYLSEGQNIFWLMNVTDITNLNVTFNIKSPINLNNIEIILKEKIDYYIDRLKLLKVVDMTESKKEIENVINYFSRLETILSSIINTDDENIDISVDKSIKTRLKFFKNRAIRKSKSIIQMLSNIANQEKVSQLNSAQQADYLRSVTTSSNAINLAKRGMKQGLDFDIKAIQEVKDMNSHLHEIVDIDDSTHTVSFYSQETTLSGIKAVCAICTVDDEYNSLTQLSALEILSLLNIVGIQCESAVGDFPDPKTYHLTDLSIGSFVSMSDVLIVKQQGGILTNPYDNTKPIHNVIPYYDDDRIQKFLMKYAPNLLEYTASLGMRNMMINIPNTYRYTAVAGVWWMVQKIQEKQNDINAQVLTNFVRTYKTAVGELFSYVPDLIKPKSAEDINLSLYIGNNGTTNMIGPIIAIQYDADKMAMMPDILRALYTFEFYQVMRKFYRSDSDGHIKRKQMLDDLLGIDPVKYGSKLPPLFESQKVPDHHGDYHVNQEIFNTIVERVHWIDYVCQIGTILGHALKTNTEALKNITVDKNKTDELELGITFDLSKFKLYCIVQGLMFDTLASRYDDTKNKMKIEDAGNERLMNNFISNYIKRQYHSHYQSELSKQNKIEIELLTQQLVVDMIETDDIQQFNQLFRKGLRKNHVSVVISDKFKAGFTELKDMLFDPSVDCELRDEKLKVLILGCDEMGNVVYNKNNTINMGTTELSRLMNLIGCGAAWNEIYDKYVEKNIHTYRESDRPNRHTHCNPKPSYWAYGYKNLRSYFDNISQREQDEYCQVHTNCCGIWDGVPVKWA